MLYLQSVEELGEWDGQSPPTPRTYKGKPVLKLSDVVGKKETPNFGPYAKEKMAAMAKGKEGEDLLGDNKLPNDRPANAPNRKIASVQEVIGTALSQIGTYNDLDNK